MNKQEFVSITIRGNSKSAILAAVDKLTRYLPDSISPVTLSESKTGKRVTLKCSLIVIPLEDGETIAAEYDYTEGHATGTFESVIYEPIKFGQPCPKCYAYYAENGKCMICGADNPLRSLTEIPSDLRSAK